METPASMRRAQALLHHRLGCREFGAGVDAGDVGRGRLQCCHANAVTACNRNHIREIIFALGVVVAHGREPAPHVLSPCAQPARVAQGDGTLIGRCVGPFDDALHIAVAEQYAPILRRIVRPHCHQHQASVAARPAIQQGAKRRGLNQGIVGVEDCHITVTELIGCLQCRMRCA